MGHAFTTLPPAALARGRGRPTLALVALSTFGIALTGCDTATEHVTVKNECDEALTVVVEEAPVPNSHGYTGADAAKYGEPVAADSSKEFGLMAAAGGFVIEALAPDGSVYGKWYSLKDSARSFTLSKVAGTCPR